MNGSGQLQTRNIFGDGLDQILARVDNQANGASDPSGVYFDLTDRQGSVRAVLNDSGTVMASIAYDSFGNEISVVSPNGAVSAPQDYVGRYTWDGYDYDASTGYYDDRARVYDPATGRWMTQDPLGFDAGDSNLYRYVNNAPTNATDPSGLDAVVEEYDAPFPIIEDMNKWVKDPPHAVDHPPAPNAWARTKQTLWNIEAKAPANATKTDETITIFFFKKVGNPYLKPVDVTQEEAPDWYFWTRKFTRVSVTEVQDYETYSVTFRYYREGWTRILSTYDAVPETVLELGKTTMEVRKLYQDFDRTVELDKEKAAEAIKKVAEMLLEKK